MPAHLPELVALLSEAVRDERTARSAQEHAGSAVRAAMRRQVEAMRELQRRGLPFTTIALHFARALGLIPSVEVRKRLAVRLRKRLSRETAGHAELQGRGLGNSGAPVPLEGSIHPQSKDTPMANRIVTRKITETLETFEEPNTDEDLPEENDEDEQDEDEREKPATRRKKR